ncbi:hypothetical protein BS78_05G010100 [Paspalum vaginatum]|nr:hypothetical protein BS78_05G010100 [Paspalum vaginatum]
MANPFGVAITEQTVKQLSYYLDQAVITQVDCAREAMRFIHADGKNLDALDYAWSLKRRYGNGVSTLVLVYNATGGRVTLEQRQDWVGRVFDVDAPRTLQNGQWAAFLHVKPPVLAQGSQAARVFRGTDVDGRTRDLLVAWSIPWNTNNRTSAYTEIGTQNYFTSRWSSMRTKLENAGTITRAKDVGRFSSTISIGGFTTSECIAVLQHQFEPLPAERFD